VYRDSTLALRVPDMLLLLLLLLLPMS